MILNYKIYWNGILTDEDTLKPGEDFRIKMFRKTLKERLSFDIDLTDKEIKEGFERVRKGHEK